MIKENCLCHRILNQFLRGGTQYTYRIAREIKSCYSITNKNIKNLEKMGLIKETQEPNSTDTRRKLLKITPEGIEVALRLNKIQRLCK